MSIEQLACAFDNVGSGFFAFAGHVHHAGSGAEGWATAGVAGDAGIARKGLRATINTSSPENSDGITASTSAPRTLRYRPCARLSERVVTITAPSAAPLRA